MKRIIFLLLLLTMGVYVGAQTMDTVRIVSNAKKFRPRENILIMFELMDTLDVSGKKTTVSRSYYFDNKSRMMSSVREYHNAAKPDVGTQVIYSFAKNKLSAVSVIPPKSMCRNCASRYFYSNDTIISKQENRYTNAHSANFIKQAHYFQSKVPHDLAWGHFDDEVIVNGKRKKLRRSY
ncbi:MAG TPA: hypothetical protein VM935_02025 [Chitinophagaceae bacterium]|jgi:hypothetical protein|nr:hypothetical protein [Chitinophagaceae bacterium]